jgi:hypothetical protein
MTLLFSKVHEHSGMLTALRACAAMLGVPCVVCGTFADVTTALGTGESGHSYDIVIPFYMFAKYLMIDTPHEAFRRYFAFDLPTFHTKPAILDAVDVAGSFYSDHRDVPESKRVALEKIMKWLDMMDPPVAEHTRWYWEKYTCQHPMNKMHRGQGHAFRLFTDIFDRMREHWKPNRVMISGERPASRDVNSEFIPRAFVIVSNMDPSQVDEIFDFVYPANDGRGGVHPNWRNAPPSGATLWPKDVLQFSLNSFKACAEPGGMGVSIDVLAAPRLFKNRHPLFLLVAMDTDDEISRTEKDIRRAYDRPIVPLPAQPPDELYLDTTKHPIYFSSEKPPTTGAEHRIIVYAYRRTQSEITQSVQHLLKLLNAEKAWVLPYAFSVAMIFKVT